MPLPVILPPTFAQRLADAERAQVGMWVCSGSTTAAEICAGSGLDWLLIDGEHAPLSLASIQEQLRAVAAYPATPVVRVPVNDRVLIKQYLDLGAQNLLVPMVDTAEAAAEAVRATRYPPEGVRGVGSALARGARWNRVERYLQRADDELVSLFVQIESATAVKDAKAIAATSGVDGIFIGPSDLAASMGLIGQQGHPEVVDAVPRAKLGRRSVSTPSTRRSPTVTSTRASTSSSSARTSPSWRGSPRGSRPSSSMNGQAGSPRRSQPATERSS